MLIALPPLHAYRADTAAAPYSELPDDSLWLTFATRIGRAAHVAGGARLSLLADLVRESGADAPESEADLRDAACALAIRTATAMEDAARFHLAFTTLSNVLVLLAGEAVRERGMVLAQQGRIARQLGEHAEARARYEAVEALADEHAQVELRARAWIGYGVLAEVRGNYPEVRSWCSRVLTLEPLPSALARMAHQSLMAAASAAKDYDAAALHAWAAFQDATGEAEAVALISLAETFMRAGHARVALRGFGAALLRPLLPRNELPALGGAAIAAARALKRSAAHPLVERFASRIQELVTSSQYPWANASALADIGDAYAALGASKAASDVRSQASAVAERHGFHELVYRVSTTASPLVRVVSLRAAASVAEAVESFATSEEVSQALAEVGS